MSEDRDTSSLETMRHSLAHIMASAVKHLWPKVKFGVGPVVENGFYYDLDLGSVNLSVEDFATIEKEMRKIIGHNQPFEQFDMNIDEAIDWANKNDQPYKHELLNDLKRSGTTSVKDIDKSELGLSTKTESKVDKVSFYKNGDFTDLCRGPHVSSTGKVGKFKLMRLSGAYWRGDESKAQMQRLYGVAFASDKELEDHLHLLEEAKLRDHRKIGQEMDLFTISDLVGSGLPIFTPRGSVLRDKLGAFSLELQALYGYEQVWTPHIAKEELYKVSGHYDKFPERFSVKSTESDDKFMMKPMNCPHHIQLFLRKPWSYRDLPIRYMEVTTNYRDEKSGELHGLSRVRAISQDDGHVFCAEEDIEKEVSSIVKMIKKMYDTLVMSYYARLSYRDNSDKYLGDPALWKKAEAAIRKIAKEEKLKTVDGVGEAAFYGPKIDFMVKDALGREWQCATIQLDFVQPTRFKLSYTDADGNQKQPVIVHKALLGAIERFLSLYIEHTAGRFPIWLSPEQIRIATINQEPKTQEFAENILNKAKELGLRATIDGSNESVGKKIRNAEVMKVPYTVVIGQSEMESKMLSPRIRGDLGGSVNALPIEDLLQAVVNESENRLNKTTL